MSSSSDPLRTCPGVLWLHSHDMPISSETQITLRTWSSPFRVRCILIPSEAAKDVVIRDIRIGLRSQLAFETGVVAEEFAWSTTIDLVPLRKTNGPHPMNAWLFHNLIPGRRRVPFDTIACTQEVVFNVAPRDPTTHVPKVFEAFLLGTMIDPPRNP